MRKIQVNVRCVDPGPSHRAIYVADCTVEGISYSSRGVPVVAGNVEGAIYTAIGELLTRSLPAEVQPFGWINLAMAVKP